MRAIEQLHPECRLSWTSGKTNYPPEEHARDCDQCQLYKLLALSDNLIPWQRDVINVLLSGNLRVIIEYARQRRQAHSEGKSMPEPVQMCAAVKSTHPRFMGS